MYLNTCAPGVLMSQALHREELTINDLPVTIDYSPGHYSTRRPAPFLIFVHGFPSHKDIGQNKEASEGIVKEGIASTVRYSSSRQWELWKAAGKDLEKKMAAFAGKEYQQEFEELKSVISYVNQRFHPEQLYLSGTSYGGGLAALLCGEEIPNLEKVLLSCPHIDPEWRKKEDWGCYRSFPPKEKFLEAIARYQGKLQIIHSSEDIIVPFWQSEELFKAATTSDKELIALPGRDHVFLEEAQKRYIEQHLAFFR